MQNIDLKGSLVLYLCLEDIGVMKLLKAEGSRFDWNLNIKLKFYMINNINELHNI